MFIHLVHIKLKGYECNWLAISKRSKGTIGQMDTSAL